MTRHQRLSKPRVVLDVRVVRGSGGGPDKTILNSPRFLEGKGYRNLCAYMHPPGDPGFEQLKRKAENWGAPLLSIPDGGPWDARVLPRFIDACRRERVAIWHGWVHHTQRTPLYYRIDRLCLPQYERVICVSEDLREACLAAGVAPERCHLVENGVCLDEFSPRTAKMDARRKLGIPNGIMLVGAAGRLSAEKGFDVLIRAVDGLTRSGTKLQLWIIGEGDEAPALANLIRELGCGEHVRLLGYRSDLRELYEAMDVFALSSIREGLPNVVLEAMAMGAALVATRVAGIPRLVPHEENGLLVSPGAEQELAEALGRLAADEDLRSRLARAARATIEADYGFAARMDKMRAIYDDLLADGGGHGRARRKNSVVAAR